jgi:endonuclease-3
MSGKRGNARAAKGAVKGAARAEAEAQKVARILAILDQLHPDPAIPLDHVDPFTLLVSVVLSAQTTDKKVNEVTPALFAEAPTPARLAAMSVERIQALIREVGLAPQKAKALRGLAEMIERDFEGRVPETLEELEQLPGVGHKTAQVVLAQAFGEPAFPVDTHIHRLAARWGLSSGKNVEHTERDLKAAFPRERWNKAHIQIILFGRAHCPALRHDFAACPICAWAASPARIAAEVKARAEKAKVKSVPSRAPTTAARERPASAGARSANTRRIG